MAKFSVCRIYKVTLWLNFSYNYIVNLLQILHLYIHPNTLQAIARTVIKKIYDKRKLKLWAIAAEFLVFYCVGLSRLKPCRHVKKWFVQNNSLRRVWVLQCGCSSACVETFSIIDAAKFPKRIFSFQKADKSLVHGGFSLCWVPMFWFMLMLSPTNSPFFPVRSARPHSQ